MQNMGAQKRDSQEWGEGGGHREGAIRLGFELCVVNLSSWESIKGVTAGETVHTMAMREQGMFNEGGDSVLIKHEAGGGE